MTTWWGGNDFCGGRILNVFLLLFFLFLGGGPKIFRAEHQFSASFPGKRAETRRKIIVRPFSRKKGGKLIFRQGGGRKAEGGFYPRPFSKLFYEFDIEALICFANSSESLFIR